MPNKVLPFPRPQERLEPFELIPGGQQLTPDYDNFCGRPGLDYFVEFTPEALHHYNQRFRRYGITARDGMYWSELCAAVCLVQEEINKGLEAVMRANIRAGRIGEAERMYLDMKAIENDISHAMDVERPSAHASDDLPANVVWLRPRVR